MKKKLSTREKTLRAATKYAHGLHAELFEAAPLDLFALINKHTQAMALYFAAVVEHYGENLTGAEIAEILRTHGLDLADQHEAYDNSY